MAGRLRSIPGAVSAFAYDPAGHITDIVSTPPRESWHYTCDNARNIPTSGCRSHRPCA